MKLFKHIQEAFIQKSPMPHHADAHIEAVSLLELHLERPVVNEDILIWPDHVQLHNEIREEILRLRKKAGEV